MALIGAIFTSKYYTKQLNSWPNSPASGVLNYSWLPASQGEMEFEEHLSTRGRLTSLKQVTANTAWATFSTNTCLNCQLMRTAIVRW